MADCRLCLLVVLCSVLFLCPAQGQISTASSSYSQTQQGSTTSSSSAATSSVDEWAVQARNNPLAFFLALGSMQPEAQRQYLKLTGAKLQQEHNLACNVFGGEASCMSLPADSEFARLCPNHDLKVDCAYFSDDEIEVNEDPTASFKRAMENAGLGALESACPECFDNQRALWCAQTVPKCGSYSATIENVLLPALSKVTRAQLTGQSAGQALSAAMPDLLAATSLSMPCKQMCEAVVSSCSCSHEQKFGALLDAYVASHTSLGQNLPSRFTTQLFGSVYDTPICSLYGDSSKSDFAGACVDNLPTQCTDSTRWCGQPGSNSSQVLLAQELMAGQVANALFGWIDAPANSLFADGTALIDDADGKDEQALEKQYLVKYGSGRGESSSTAAAIAHWTVLALCIVAALAGGFVFYKWRQRRNQATDGYLSMAALDGDDERARNTF